jgi:hypothetical protein
MHKLIEYICDELEKVEQQAETGKLSMSELEYADKLAHLKKNLLRADELMDKGYSGEVRRYPFSYRGGYDDGSRTYDGGRSYDNRGRGSQANRDSRGRYSSRYIRDDYSMNTDEIVHDLRSLINMAPDERMRQELQRITTKVEQMDD